MAVDEAGRVALVMRGNRELRDTTTVETFRLNPIAKALTDVGLAPEPAFYQKTWPMKSATNSCARDLPCESNRSGVWSRPRDALGLAIGAGTRCSA